MKWFWDEAMFGHWDKVDDGRFRGQPTGGGLRSANPRWCQYGYASVTAPAASDRATCAAVTLNEPLLASVRVRLLAAETLAEIAPTKP